MVPDPPTGPDGGVSRDPYRVGSYVIGRLLGAGSFSRVFTCIDVDNYVFAMKIVNRVQHRKSMDAVILRELAIMQKLSHPFIIRLYDVMKSKRHFYVVLELVQGGELAREIEVNRRLSEERTRFYFHQLMIGVRYMHMNGIAHRDLKAQNLLLDDEGNLRISDFGLSNIKQSDGLNWTQCGTMAYMAPEVQLKQGYDGFAADIWSCGCILYHMVTGRRPFSGTDREDLKEKIMRCQYDPIPDEIAPGAVSMIKRMLVIPYQKRIKMEEIIQHPWFLTGFDRSMLKMGKWT